MRLEGSLELIIARTESGGETFASESRHSSLSCAGLDLRIHLSTQ
jgi:hypothetical protein